MSNLGDRKGTTKKLCDKNFAERSGELSAAICLKTLVLQGNDPVVPSNCSENSLVLFMRFFGFVSPFFLPENPNVVVQHHVHIQQANLIAHINRGSFKTAL